MRSDEEKAKHLEEVLGAPFLEDFPDNALKIRRNLLLFASFAVGIHMSNLKISGGSFLGLTIQGLDTELVKHVLFWSLIYHFTHFWYQSYDYTKKWRLRLTGNLTANRGFKTDHNEDFADNPKQTTLYNWWKQQAYQIESPTKILDQLSKAHENLEDFYTRFKASEDTPNKDQIVMSMHEPISKLKNIISQYERNNEETKKILDSKRIIWSLKKFDDWFWNFQWQQLVRLFCLEFYFPAFLGITGIYFTSPFEFKTTIGFIMIICISPIFLSAFLILTKKIISKF